MTEAIKDLPALAPAERAAVVLQSAKATAELTALVESSQSIIAITSADGRTECHAAAALERLTQPVGVDAIGWLTEDGRVTLDVAAPIKFGEHWRVPIYSAETVARLQAERDEWKAKAIHWDGRYKHERDLYDFLQSRLDALQEAGEGLRDAVLLFAKRRQAGTISIDSISAHFDLLEALAGTENKEPTA